MNKLLRLPIVIVSIALMMPGCVKKPPRGLDYPVQQVPFTSVKLTDNFWAPRIKKNAEINIPIAFGFCESTGSVKNLKITGGDYAGKIKSGSLFNDSDLFKTIEGASYSLQTFPDPVLDVYLDTLIKKIRMAQESDGYILPNHVIETIRNGAGPNKPAGEKRSVPDSILSQELYNLGHLYEAAVAYYQATGESTLLEIALKSADLINTDSGRNRTRFYPGHAEIEIGLVKLYRITGENKCLDLARFYLDNYGPDADRFNLAYLKTADKSEPADITAGASYFYSGMADIGALESDKRYLDTITKFWEDLVYDKIVITGGIRTSAGNGELSGPVDLQNMSDFCEACTFPEDIFFNHRLFLLYGQSKYYDLLEKILYNSILSGIPLSADKFSYINPGGPDSQNKNIEGSGGTCCLSNLVRLIPSIPGYIYAVKEKEMYVNLFISNNAVINVGKSRVSVSLKANFPWDGKVEMSVNADAPAKFTVKIRIPGWAVNEAFPGGLYRFTDNNDNDIKLTVNGESTGIIIRDGYAVLKRKWKNGDKIAAEFPMPVRRVADERDKKYAGKIAYQRGPVIFCAEWPDNESGNVLNLVVNKDAPVSTEFISTLLDGTQVIRTSGFQTRKTLKGNVEMFSEEQITLIPFALRNNRGPGQMTVWLATSPGKARSLPAPTIAFRSKIRASKMTKAISAINDQIEPENSDDNSVQHFDWWPEKDRWVWIEYNFDKPETISKSKVYWFDNGPDGECRVPDEWEILYLDKNIWKSVVTKSKYKVTKDNWNSVIFKPVITSSVKIKLKLNKIYSGGIYEWVVE